MYIKKFVNITSLIISVVIFFVLNYSITASEPIKDNNFIDTKNEIQVTNNNQIYVKEEKKKEEDNKIIGKIIIPSINLEAQIKEGTSNAVINSYVGHFEKTSINEGNIGLAAHNRSDKVAEYFKDIKKLKKGDEIIYETKDIKRIYIVDIITIIKETDWSYLEKTKDNRITLITCVENQREYRLCVQGVEK